MKSQMAAVLTERLKQKRLWGEVHDPGDGIFLAVLTEEVGEVAREINSPWPGPADPTRMKEELAQIAAVAVAWMEALDARVGG